MKSKTDKTGKINQTGKQLQRCLLEEVAIINLTTPDGNSSHSEIVYLCLN